MNAPIRPISINLLEHTKSYDFDEKKFTQINNYVIERILDYHPDLGRYIAHHLIRFSKNLSGFMQFMNTVEDSPVFFDEDTIRKISMSGKVHDGGKIMQDISVHLHREGKPSQELKDERLLHRLYLRDVVEDAIRKTGTRLDNDDWRHAETMFYISENHHERLDGSGPAKLAGDSMDDILRMITIVDEVDGKIKVEGKKDLKTIFGEICGEKHEGMFDIGLSQNYSVFCRNNGLYQNFGAILNAPYLRTS